MAQRDQGLIAAATSAERVEPRGIRAMVVTSNFPPDASVGTMRTLRLVRHLANMGWNVDVVTASPQGFRAGTVIDPALVESVPPAVRVVRARALRPAERLGATLRPRPKSGEGTTAGADSAAARAGQPARDRLARVKRALSVGLALPDREISWLLPAVLSGWRAARQVRPDVIYSSGPPFTAHLVGAALSRLMRRPWVADFRDPWARAPWREGAFAVERFVWRVCERLVVKHADALLFVTDTNMRDFARHYGPSFQPRMHLVPNGCDKSEFEGLSARRDHAAGPFVLLHAGSLYGARNPAPLFRALAAAMASGAIDRDQFAVRFIGRFGIPGVDLPALARDLGLEHAVEFISHMPRRAVMQEMLDASALLILQPVTTVSIPAKLYEYMAAGRPILALAEPGGETAELVQQSGAGVAVLADDEQAIGQAIQALMRRSREGFSGVDSRYFDGAARAADTRQILFDLSQGEHRTRSRDREPAVASHAPQAFEPVLTKLRLEAAEQFGSADAQLLPVAFEERPYSYLLRVKVSTPVAGQEDSHIFIKIFKPKPHDGGVEKMRVRVAHDFATTRRIYEAMSGWPDLSAIRPIVCYINELAIVTEEAQGTTLLAHLQAHAAWFPAAETVRALEGTMAQVGRWVRAFQSIDPAPQRVPVGTLLEYVDVRLKRMVDRGVFTARDRQRVLDHLDALGSEIAPTDLQEVIAHADLAPGNILISGRRVVVLDFAMANRASTLHDISRLFLQLDLLRAKPQFRPPVVRALQRALLQGFDLSLTADRPLFRFLLMLHRVNHLGTLTMGHERFPASAFSSHIRRLHRRWIDRELSAGIAAPEAR